jgi:formylglycine-generating enzyme required for sulfatase activity
MTTVRILGSALLVLAASRAEAGDVIPAWYRTLPEDERPALPLQERIKFSPTQAMTYLYVIRPFNLEHLDPEITTEVVYVPGGRFLMGSREGRPDETPVHEVELSPYFIGKNELMTSEIVYFGPHTTEEADGLVFDGKRCRMTRARVTPLRPWGNDVLALPTQPAIQMSWDEAAEVLRGWDARLPTEAEWEMAAVWDRKGKRSLRYSWGDGAPPVEAAVAGDAFRQRYPRLPELKSFAECPDQEIDALVDGWTVPCLPVFEGYSGQVLRTFSSFRKGPSSPCGALDMTGGVYEWCQDVYDPLFYARSPARDPVCELDRPSGPEPQRRVIRGGSWASTPAATRGAYRGYADPRVRCEFIGFRVCVPERGRAPRPTSISMPASTSPTSSPSSTTSKPPVSVETPPAPPSLPRPIPWCCGLLVLLTFASIAFLLLRRWRRRREERV